MINLMITTQKEFIQKFLPASINDISYAQIDLDISDLSISDILRNINTVYPNNSRCRNQIESGQLAVAVMCKSELMYPIKGLLIIVANTRQPIEVASKDYVVMTVSDEDIRNDHTIVDIMSALTLYLIKNFKDVFEDFQKFYLKYIYNPEEDPEWEREYTDI